MPRIPGFGRLRQEDWKFRASLLNCELHANLNYTERSYINKCEGAGPVQQIPPTS